MSEYWNLRLSIWASPPSVTQEDKSRNARERIERALRGRFGKNIKVYLQGSYKNRTNVKQESDIDIIVEYTPAFYVDLDHLSPDARAYYMNYLFSPSYYTVEQFKIDVEHALVEEFDRSTIENSEKCIKVHKNDYRTNADVIPCFTHTTMADLNNALHHGIFFKTNSGIDITSYPIKHCDNGERKNLETDGRYKDYVRILKNTKYALIEANRIAESDMRSYLIENLLWNIDNTLFNSAGSHYERLRSILIQLYSDMNNDRVNQYTHVHGIYYLFRTENNPITVKQFIQHAWEMFGYN